MFRILLHSLRCLSLASLAAAAPITWQAPLTIAADTDVSTAGTAVFAYDWKSAAQAVNGVAFTPPGAGVTLGWSGGRTYGSFVSDAGIAMPADGLSAAYKNILNGARYGSTATGSEPLTYHGSTAPNPSPPPPSWS